MNKSEGSPAPNAKTTPESDKPVHQALPRHAAGQKGNKATPAKIRIKNVNFYYGKKQALKNISFDVAERRVTALIGPSGCGKTTLLRILNRLCDLIEGAKYEGEVHTDGRNVLDKQTDVVALRRKIGMVFQKPNPFAKSIYENLTWGVNLYRRHSRAELDETVEKSLRKAALWDEVKDDLTKPATALSGGQQQRLCIARTLAVMPDIILMDEPTASLDPIGTRKIEELMDTLVREFTIVIVTHNMQQAKRISHKTAFFHLGNLVESGETHEFFESPKNPLTQAYVAGQFG